MLPADESRWEHPIRKRPEASQAWVALVDRDARRLLGPLTPGRGSGSTTLPGSAGSALPPQTGRNRVAVAS